MHARTHACTHMSISIYVSVYLSIYAVYPVLADGLYQQKLNFIIMSMEYNYALALAHLSLSPARFKCILHL